MSNTEQVVDQEPAFLCEKGHFNPEWIAWYRKKHDCGFSEALGIATIRRRKLFSKEVPFVSGHSTQPKPLTPKE